MSGDMTTTGVAIAGDGGREATTLHSLLITQYPSLF